MSEYKLRVAWSEVYEWTSEGEGNHICGKDGFTIGHFKTVDDAKEELNEFFGSEPDYEAYADEKFLVCDRLEDIDGNHLNYQFEPFNPQYIVIYTVLLEKISPVSWSCVIED